MPPDEADKKSLLDELRKKKPEDIQKKVDEVESPASDHVPSFVEDTRRKLDASNTEIVLHLHKLLKVGMTCLFAFMVIAFGYILAALGCLVYKYIGFIVQSEEALTALLAHIWTVLSGAFIVVFFQFVLNVAKRISSNGNGSL